MRSKQGKSPDSENENEAFEDGVFCTGSPDSSSHSKWLIDSGATSHMTHSRELMLNYNELKIPQRVSLGDGRTVEAVGIGDIRVTMTFKVSRHKICVMKDVLHVPKLMYNLFYVRAAASKGNSIKFGRGKCWIKAFGYGLSGKKAVHAKL